MALTCDLTLGGNAIGFLYAQRLTPGIRPESVNTYRAVLDRNGERWEGEVRHRYGDGAWALVQRVIQAADRSDGAV